MYLSMLKKSSLILLLLTSCNKGSIEVPTKWHTPLIAEMAVENPSRYLWWQAFSDCLLNELIENSCHSFDIARSYIELRGLQARLEILEKQITAQDTALNLNQGLTSVGFISTIHQNANIAQLFTLFTQKAELNLASDRAIFHLSTLTNEPLDCLYDRLAPRPLFDLPCYIPVRTPCDIACKTHAIFEQVEGALAGLKAEREIVSYLENIKCLKTENYQLVKDLNEQGLKSDAELQAAYLELLIAEDALIQAKVKLLLEYVNLYEAQGA